MMGPTQSYPARPWAARLSRRAKFAQHRGHHSVPGASWRAAELASTMLFGLQQDVANLSEKRELPILVDSRNAIAKKLSADRVASGYLTLSWRWRDQSNIW